MKQPKWIKDLSEHGIEWQRWSDAVNWYDSKGWQLTHVKKYNEFWLTTWHPKSPTTFVKCRMGIDSAVQAIIDPDYQLVRCNLMLTKMLKTPEDKIQFSGFVKVKDMKNIDDEN